MLRFGLFLCIDLEYYFAGISSPLLKTIRHMHSIRLQLKILFIAFVTLTLGLFGAYSQYLLAKDLETKFTQTKRGVLTRLQINLPVPLWNIDVTMVGSIIEAEMLNEQVVGISIRDNSGKNFNSKFRNQAGELVVTATAARLDSPPVTLDLRYSDNQDTLQEQPARAELVIGQAQVYFSRATIDATLRSQFLRRMAEILLLDAILVLALAFSLRTVFVPLAQLRDALFELASQNSDEVKELPENVKNEFGEVIHGFNQIQRKLQHVIERQAEAQQEALEATSKTRAAYEQLQQAQDILLQSEKLASLGSLVAGIAHEINTPVGITLTSASILHEATGKILHAMQQGAIAKSEIMGYLDTANESSRLILSNAERAAHLINSFKQIAADQSSEVRRSFDLHAYLDEIIASLSPKIKRCGASVNVNVDCAQAIQMDSYPGALAQVITNLTLNAITHAFAPGSNGQIQISITAQAGAVRIRFQDNGCGIPSEHLSRIFEPFFTTRRGQGGTGLGLNIVYNIMTKQLNGAITVESEPGVGSCFILDLPCVAAHPSA